MTYGAVLPRVRHVSMCQKVDKRVEKPREQRRRERRKMTEQVPDLDRSLATSMSPDHHDRGL